MENQAIFTTSWDDGHPLDARVAALLSRHGFQGTFYMPLSNREGLPVMPPGEMRRLGQGFEIGSHTIDHCYLKTVGAAEARRQIVGGKSQIEQILGHRVSGFCYPGGYGTPEHRQMVVDAGYDYARTTANFFRTLSADPFRMPTMIQYCNHKRRVFVRNFIRQGEWGPRYDLLRIALRSSDLLFRLRALLDYVCLHGGVFHLWGHSWELEAFDGWRQMDNFLRYAAERIPAGGRLSNREVQQLALRMAVEQPGVVGSLPGKIPLIEDIVTHSHNEIRQAPGTAAHTKSQFAPKVVLVTNIPAPYRVPVYNRIAADSRIDFTAIFCAEREPNRPWDLEPFKFKSVVLRESFATLHGRFIHNNLGVLRQLKAIDPDVVITSGFNPTHLYAFLYARLHGCKHICWTDGTLTSERNLSAIHKRVRRIVFRRSAAFIGSSDGSFDLYRSYGIANERLFKSHLCVDNRRFRHARTQPKRYDLLFCGRLVQVKDPLFAIDVAERVTALLGRRVSLLFVGSGELESQLRASAASATGADVTFHGFASQAELPGLYGSARIFLFPTSWDPWGVVLNEACAAGLPVIATPFAGAVGEIVQDGVNAFVRNPDVEEWAAAAQRLLTDEQLYETFARNSPQLVAGHTYAAAAAGVIDASLAALA